MGLENPMMESWSVTVIVFKPIVVFVYGIGKLNSSFDLLFVGGVNDIRKLFDNPLVKVTGAL